jgi:hypothetical protein
MLLQSSNLRKMPNYIHNVRWILPDKFSNPMQKVQEAATQLADSVGHQFLKFSLDGHLVGDLGVAIAEHFFGITPHDAQKTGHDATLKRGKVIESVEIKIRRQSTNISFDSEPDHIIALRLEPGDKMVTLVYAGPGSVLRAIRPNAAYAETQAHALIRKFERGQKVSLNQLAEHFDYKAFMKKPSIPIRNQPTVAS